MGDSGAAAISEGLKMNTTLKKLDIGSLFINNHINSLRVHTIHLLTWQQQILVLNTRGQFR